MQPSDKEPEPPDEPASTSDGEYGWADTVAQAHKQFSQEANPLYIWKLIALAVREAVYQAAHDAKSDDDALQAMDNATPLPLPRWVWNYLEDVAWRFDELASGRDWRRYPTRILRDELKQREIEDRYRNTFTAPAKKSTALVPFSMGLARKGWNAFDDWRSNHHSEVINFYINSNVEKGMSISQARDAVMSQFEYTDERAFRRRSARGRIGNPIRPATMGKPPDDEGGGEPTL
jgi:hypothetical protein